jgi:hypothetical protein
MPNFKGALKTKLPKKLEDRVSLLFIIITLLLAFFLTFSISFIVGKPIGTDFWFHLKIAESYARGENALFNEEFMAPNRGPYPPLFHLMLALFVTSGFILQIATFLQVMFYPLALFTSVFLVWKRINASSASFVSIALFSSVAFFDRSMQVIPQAFDMILFPLAIYFFLTKRRIFFLISMSIMIYSHGAFGFLLFSSLVLYNLKYKVSKKMIIDVLVATIPILVLILVFLPSQIGLINDIKNPQEKLIKENPISLFVYMGIFPTSTFIVSLMHFFHKKRKLSKTEIMSLLWLIVLLPVIVFYPDRFCTYAVVPVSILASKFLSDISFAHGRWLGLLLLVFSFAISLITYLNWWQVLYETSSVSFDIH